MEELKKHEEYYFEFEEQKKFFNTYIRKRDFYIIKLCEWVSHLTHIADEIRETQMDEELEKNIRYDMVYIMETYMKYYSYIKKDNSKTCKNMWWDCIRVINKYDFVPAKWPEMDLLIKKAIEYFELDDNRE